MNDLVERLRARTFSRWESDVQAVMDYEDDLCTEAAAEIERLRTSLKWISTTAKDRSEKAWYRLDSIADEADRALKEVSNG